MCSARICGAASRTAAIARLSDDATPHNYPYRLLSQPSRPPL
jgi:hypothetical protein